MIWRNKVHRLQGDIDVAQKVQVILVDDVDGGEAAETVAFALDGVSYEIDLSDDNAGELRDSLAKWIGHARRTGGRSTVRSRSTSGRARGSASGAKPDLSAVRTWARENGFSVSDRGRVSSEVLAAYDSANA
jgi:hypothetical protein